MNTLPAVILALYAQLVIATPCNTALHHNFDFWLGDWQVYKPDGSLAGYNSVSKDYDNCVLRERYQSISGFNGESLNIYDSSRGVWHQSWVDNSGTLLLLQGNLVDGDMLLTGTATTAEGKPQQHQIRWTPNSDGTVRQHWQTKIADGHWDTIFDGLYKKSSDADE